jgi:GNAT superfamily N-acetyltransferase
MDIHIADTDARIMACFPVLRQLRPHLVEGTFIADVRRMQGTGFVLACLVDSEVRAVAGYREMEMFATGRILYVDDLVTDSEHRSRGYGKSLLRWLLEEARRRGCAYLELDSGLKRLDAHRFYRRHGLEEVALHFSIPTSGGPKWSGDSAA